MANYYNLPADTAARIDTHEAEIRQFRAGELDAADFKHRRVPRGIYEQRHNGTYMLRVRLTGGVFTPAQARAIAAASRRYGAPYVHVTSRQDIQLHDLKLDDTPAAMRELLAAGLSSFGGGGNTVRNITACPLSGICPRQVFDVLPFTQRLTEYLLANPSPTGLPRKYKLGFSGCANDCVAARCQDLGFIAREQQGQAGFEVWGGGGMGARSRVAERLVDWLPAGDALRAAIAMRQLFAREGDRTNRNRARLRFVLDRLGVDEFRRQFQAEFHSTAVPTLPAPPPTAAVTGAAPAVDGHLTWLAQRQEGRLAVRLELPLGLLANDDLERLATIAETHSTQPELRATVNQDLLLPFIPATARTAVRRDLEAVSLDLAAPAVLPKFTACTGAATCRLGICRSRDAAIAAARALDDGGLTPSTIAELRVHVSGCPNACGRHPLAALGFYGGAKRHHDTAVPAYHVLIGGGTDGDGPRFGQPVGTVPARRLPDFMVALLRRYELAGGEAPPLAAWLSELDPAVVEALLAEFTEIPPPAAAPLMYQDWGEDVPFSPKRPGPGETAGPTVQGRS